MASLWLGASGAQAQVVINEVFENPPGIAEEYDARWEYIELYGEPGFDLTGYAIVLIKGAADLDKDGVVDAGYVPEIDEAFSLDGCVLSEDGLFTLVNTDMHGSTGAADRGLRRRKDYQFRMPDSHNNRRWHDGLSFQAAQIPSPFPSGCLDNEGSSTYMLVRQRPGCEQTPAGTVYGPEYGWTKGVRIDADFDGRIDELGAWPETVGAKSRPRLEPFQCVDELAWSNHAGREYVRDPEHKVSDTPNMNPDAVSRLAYFLSNPERGHRTISTGAGKDADATFRFASTTIADESFVYGLLETRRFPKSIAYFTGFDLYGWPRTKGPTDPDGPRYTGQCDPEPDHRGFPEFCATDPRGAYLLNDLDTMGFALTPGALNRHPTNPRLQQFTFTRGDFNMDGRVDAADGELIRARVGASADERVQSDVDGDALVTRGVDRSDAQDLRPYRFQNGELQQLLMMMSMDKTDGPTGGNAGAVTERDVAAHAFLINPNVVTSQ